MADRIQTHTDLNVYRDAFDTAMEIFQISKSFPQEERYSLTDQIRRSSRSVSANLAEAWRKRRYKKSFISKLSDCEAEAAETQVWIEFAVQCEYISAEHGRELYKQYDKMLRTFVGMIIHSNKWTLK